MLRTRSHTASLNTNGRLPTLAQTSVLSAFSTKTKKNRSSVFLLAFFLFGGRVSLLRRRCLLVGWSPSIFFSCRISERAPGECTARGVGARGEIGPRGSGCSILHPAATLEAGALRTCNRSNVAIRCLGKMRRSAPFGGKSLGRV